MIDTTSYNTRAAARSHYNQLHPDEGFRFHIVFRNHEHEDLTPCSNPVHCYEDSSIHLLDVDIYMNGVSLQKLPAIGATSVNDYTHILLDGSEDTDMVLRIDFICAEKIYRLTYTLSEFGVGSVYVHEWVYGGHLCSPADMSRTYTTMKMLIEPCLPHQHGTRYHTDDGYWSQEDSDIPSSITG